MAQRKQETPEHSGPTSGYPGAPRWVKVSAVLIMVFALLLLVLLLVRSRGEGRHGPGRHFSSVESREPSGVVRPGRIGTLRVGFANWRTRGSRA